MVVKHPILSRYKREEKISSRLSFDNWISGVSEYGIFVRSDKSEAAMTTGNPVRAISFGSKAVRGEQSCDEARSDNDTSVKTQLAGGRER